MQGSVSDRDNRPVTDVWAVLLPVGEPRAQDGLSQKVATDQHGHFLLRGIPPGEYQLFCWDEVEDGGWEDPDFLKAFENQGRRVSLKKPTPRPWISWSLKPRALIERMRCFYKGRREERTKSRSTVTLGP